MRKDKKISRINPEPIHAARNKRRSLVLFSFLQWDVKNCSRGPPKTSSPIRLHVYFFVAAAICLSRPDLNTWSACNLLMEIGRWQRQKEGRRETRNEEKKEGENTPWRSPESGNERLCAANFLIRGRGDHRHCGSGGATSPRLWERMHANRTSGEEIRTEPDRTESWSQEHPACLI